MATWELLEKMVYTVYTCTPDHLASLATPLLNDIASSAQGGEDHISALPCDILRNIVSRLPTKDAARTTVLSNRFRGIWRSTPLRLEVSSFFGSTATVSGALACHPGPCCSTRLIVYTDQDEVNRWIPLLVAKGVQYLTLVNGPESLDVALPASILSCASLHHLFLGLYSFPDTTGLPRGPEVFPLLERFSIAHINIKEHDLEYVLECSPRLSIFATISSYLPERVRIRSNSLRCVLFWLSIAQELDVVDAPHLQRLILRSVGRITMKVKIGYAPELTVLGYLDTAFHTVEVDNTTIIKAGVKTVSSRALVRSVKVLGLKVYFGEESEVRTLLSLLTCFPEVETLHVKSKQSEDEFEVSAELSSTFWQEVATIQCVLSHVKTVVFDQFRCESNALGFLEMVFTRAPLLQKMTVNLNCALEICCFAFDKLRSLCDKYCSDDVDFTLTVPRHADTPSWSYRKASDLCVSDPFVPDQWP